ncbi:MAG TPA: mycothiol synthase [Acidimicrobiales bacterium]|nr:mycothiol synthase [Acidimicrobiales bacterium]
MAGLEVKRQMGRGDIAAVAELLEVAKEVDGHAPLGEHKWLDLLDGGREGFAGLVAWQPGHGHPIGYAQLTASEGSADRRRTWALEVVVDPHHREVTPGIAENLIEAALEVIRAEGGGHVHFWVPKPGPHQDALAARMGLRRGRELRQLRRPLPLVVAGREPLALRPFRPGLDEPAWLKVNNRAFRGHDEQGDWDLDTLDNREQQPWFDASGLLLHERDGELAGFCWTKVHGDEKPALGEIYVVAVDPAFQGHGLGRALTIAGLDHLASRGLAVAMLYVDAENQAAVRLYEALGFELDHIDRAYIGDVA